MNIVPCLLLLLGAVANDEDGMVYSTEDWVKLVSAINSNPASTWVAGVPRARDLHRVQDLLGFRPFVGKSPAFKSFPPRTTALPTDYDARKAFPGCAQMQKVRDQCGCGSCFAFGAIEAFEDRICIHNKKNVTLSTEDIISCHTDENMSCQGGNPITVWENIFAGKGGNDGAIQESCYPYEIKPCPCNHHAVNSSLPKCPAEGSGGGTPTCDFTKKFACQDKGLFKSDVNLIIAGDMEQEIFENGPITVAYEVYDDFLTYKSGVYEHSPSAKTLGGHSVKIVGYGVANGVKYWTVANSWNSQFGENGFFRILRGDDECGIESQAVVAGMPQAPVAVV